MQIESMEIEETNELKLGLLETTKAKKSKNHACLLKWCKYSSYEQFVTTHQYLQIQLLIEESKVVADPDSQDVKESLCTLYYNAFPKSPRPNMVGKEWTKLGFQSENPMSDLRSSGKLSLDNLTYFSDHYQQTFIKCVTESTEYPFIASAINLTTLLLIHLHIYVKYTLCPCCGTSFRTTKIKIPIREMSVFAGWLEDTEWDIVFNELFSISLMLMHHNYMQFVKNDSTFTILEFRKIFVETKNQVLSLLRKQPSSVFDMLALANCYLLPK